MEGGEEDFATYLRRFEHFLKANGIENEGRKVSSLITSMGKAAFKTLENLLHPDLPEAKTYQQLVEVLKSHYMPAKMVIAERFKFNRRYQQEGEDVSAFAVELKRLAAQCDFGTFLDDALRDRFVAGLRDKATQTELLKKSALTFASALVLAKSTERAQRETRSIQPERTSTDSVQVIQPRGNKSSGERSTKEGKNCYRCGGQHDPRNCRLKSTDVTCAKGRAILQKCVPVRHL